MCIFFSKTNKMNFFAIFVLCCFPLLFVFDESQIKHVISGSHAQVLNMLHAIDELLETGQGELPVWFKFVSLPSSNGKRAINMVWLEDEEESEIPEWVNKESKDIPF